MFRKSVNLVTLFLAVVMLLSIAIGANAVKPKLILYQGLHWAGSTPTDIAARINLIKTRPFDGMVIHSNSEYIMKPGNTSTYASCMNDFAAISQITTFAGTTFTDNFPMVRVYRPGTGAAGDYFDDVAWSACANRYGYFAKMCKDKGFVGLWIDTEDYAPTNTEKLFSWPATNINYPNGPTLEQYVAQARLRGRQMMESIIANYPDVVVFIAVGPTHYASYMRWMRPIPSPSDPTPASYQLQGAFVIGLVEGKGESAKVIDGFEQYSNLSWVDYDTYAYRDAKYMFPVSYYTPAMLPANEVLAWSNNISQGNSSDDLVHYPDLDPETDAVTQNQITWGLRRCDDYTWYYAQRYDWTLSSGTTYPYEVPPSSLIAAVSAARATANSRIPGIQWYSNNFQNSSLAQNAAGWTGSGTTWAIYNSVRNAASTKTYNKSASATEGFAILDGDESANGKKTWTNYDVSAWVRIDGSTGSAGICGRVKDTSNYYLFDLEGSGWRLYKCVSGSRTQVASGTYNWGANKWYMLKLSVNGRQISPQISTNGTRFTSLTTYTDTNTNSLSSGTIALWGKTSITRFDDVKVVCK